MLNACRSRFIKYSVHKSVKSSIHNFCSDVDIEAIVKFMHVSQHQFGNVITRLASPYTYTTSSQSQNPLKVTFGQFVTSSLRSDCPVSLLRMYHIRCAKGEVVAYVLAASVDGRRQTVGARPVKTVRLCVCVYGGGGAAAGLVATVLPGAVYCWPVGTGGAADTRCPRRWLAAH